MDYKKHYDSLITKSRLRTFESTEYREKHHIVPRCMGGSDDPENIVELTPEEHYVAHQLLVKMHPKHSGLVWAALQMSGHSMNNERSNNKIYGWLKRRHQNIAKKRVGEKNGGFGTHWYHHPETLHSIKCKPESVPEGYVKGRTPNKKCLVCKKDTGNKLRKYCDVHRLEFKKTQGNRNFSESRKKKKIADDVIKDALIEAKMNKSKALEDIGLTVTGFNWKRVTEISNKLIKENPALEELQNIWLDRANTNNNNNRGKSWYYNPDNGHSILTFGEKVPKGYIKGRKTI
jgi:hypothetical protein